VSGFPSMGDELPDDVQLRVRVAINAEMLKHGQCDADVMASFQYVAVVAYREGVIYERLRAAPQPVTPRPDAKASFSDFIRNGTPEEKEAVYADVMKRASARQNSLASMAPDDVIKAICKWMAWDYGDKDMRADANELYCVILSANARNE
jgi:hypothetical protein